MLLDVAADKTDDARRPYGVALTVEGTLLPDEVHAAVFQHRQELTHRHVCGGQSYVRAKRPRARAHRSGNGTAPLGTEWIR